jgi:hypothetical protein
MAKSVTKPVSGVLALRAAKLARSEKRNNEAIEAGLSEGARALRALGVNLAGAPVGELAYYICGGEKGSRVKTGRMTVAALCKETELSHRDMYIAIEDFVRKSEFFPLFGYVAEFDAENDRLTVSAREMAAKPRKARKLAPPASQVALPAPVDKETA